MLNFGGATSLKRMDCQCNGMAFAKKAKGSQLGEAVWKSKCNHFEPSYSHSARAAWSANKLVVNTRNLFRGPLGFDHHSSFMAPWHSFVMLSRLSGISATCWTNEHKIFSRDIQTRQAAACKFFATLHGAATESDDTLLPSTQTGPPHHVALLKRLHVGVFDLGAATESNMWSSLLVDPLIHLEDMENDMKGAKEMIVFHPPVFKWCWYGFAILRKLFEG